MLAGGLALLCGIQLSKRGRLVLGNAVAAAAPVEAGVLLAANWREHVNASSGHVLVTATVFLLSGIVVAGLALLVDGGSPVGRRGFRAVCATVLVLDVLSLVVTWSGSLPGEALRALLSLVVLTLVLALGTPVAQRLSRP